MQGAEYVYENSWGEQLSTVVNPIPVVLNLCTEECTVLNTSQVGDISCKCTCSVRIYCTCLWSWCSSMVLTRFKYLLLQYLIRFSKMKVLVIISMFCPWGGGGGHLQGFLNIILASKHVLRILKLPYPCEKGPMSGGPNIGPRLVDGPIFEVSVLQLDPKECTGKLPMGSS